MVRGRGGTACVPLLFSDTQWTLPGNTICIKLDNFAPQQVLVFCHCRLSGECLPTQVTRVFRQLIRLVFNMPTIIRPAGHPCCQQRNFGREAEESGVLSEHPRWKIPVPDCWRRAASRLGLAAVGNTACADNGCDHCVVLVEWFI